jgi:hypothetical protein
MNVRRTLIFIALALSALFLVFFGFELTFLGTRPDSPPCGMGSLDCPVLWGSGVAAIVSGILILLVLFIISSAPKHESPSFP